MPIKPERKKLYPKNWKEIRAKILKRAGNKCELCGVPNGDGVRRCKLDPVYWQHEAFIEETALADWLETKIVLTVHHINHDPTDNRNCNLVALCQRCHLRLDMPWRKRNMKIVYGLHRDVCLICTGHSTLIGIFTTLDKAKEYTEKDGDWIQVGSMTYLQEGKVFYTIKEMPLDSESTFSTAGSLTAGYAVEKTGRERGMIRRKCKFCGSGEASDLNTGSGAILFDCGTWKIGDGHIRGHFCYKYELNEKDARIKELESENEFLKTSKEHGLKNAHDLNEKYARQIRELEGVLRELVAIVRGECSWVLDDEFEGYADLSIKIDKILKGRNHE